MLHAALVMRVVSDLLEWQAGRRWSGVATLIALAGFGLALAATRARVGAGLARAAKLREVGPEPSETIDRPSSEGLRA